MKTTLPSRHPRARAFGWLLGAMFGVWMLGAAYTPAVAATGPQPWMGAAPEPAPAAASTSAPASSSTVVVDQQPLTVQPTIPPNIMLMLDDSGSMAWDYMPDACYLYGVTCGPTVTTTRHGTTSTCNSSTSPIDNVGNGVGQCADTISAVNNQAMIDASNNGIYYNPSVLYTPPPTAGGGSYTSFTDITSVPVDGFNASGGNVNLTNYSTSDVTGENDNDNYSINYSASNQQTVTTTKNNAFNQQVSADQKNTGTRKHPVYTYVAPYADAVCQTDAQSYQNVTNYSFVGAQADSYGNWDTGTCSFSYTTTTTKLVTFYYFQYTTGAANGPYTTYYIAPSSQGCGPNPPANCYLSSDNSGVVAPAKDSSGSALAAGTNIANWFAYYHTRIQMAKSGLMTAFSTVNSTYRVGFGSIDNNGSSSITSLGSGFYKKFNSQYIAYVQPFGDGSSGTQKANFWSWASSINPNNGTPLRQALDSVGQYYQSSQPWTTLSTDPTYGTVNASTPIACRQAYTILTTDGFWNDSYSSSAETGASSGKWPAVTGPNNQSWPTTANSSPAAPYSGGSPSSGPSLADVAMYYWENDLQPSTSNSSGISNEVPPSTDDPAFWQHMTTFTMGLGFTPLDAKSNSIDTTAVFSWANGGTQPSNWGGWPTPTSNSLNNIADLAHAAVNGHGGFYSATSPQSFSSGLTDALKRASERVGTGASLAANSTQLTSGTVAYQAQYVTSQWYGDLLAYSIDSSTGAVSTTASWSASSMLSSSATSGTFPNRAITTYVPASATWTSGTGSFVAFKNSSSTTPPSLSSSQLSALGSDAAAQANMVNYLRGDDTLEQKNNGSYRNREKVLGDVVDSQPVYSGAPNPNEFEGESFTGISNSATSGDNSFNAFAVGTTSGGTATASAASTRTPLVFVAANDGMLHAFKASDGSEQYAYLPGAVITAGLSKLADPDYGSTDSVPHQYYNDGELTIADVFFSSAWHTVLVGTTGRGLAKTIYALDITDPANITPLWERSAGDGGTNADYIGQMVGKPVIAQVADGNWQVLIGNGYNSKNGTAALLEFSVVDGTLSVHTTDSTVANGLAAPVTWMDDASNGISMEAYAGDLQGRVWEFPLDTATTTTTGSGSSAVTTTTYTADLISAGTKEFTADSGGTVQPITAGMLAGRDPVTGNVWVFFGTGQYLTSSDLTNKQVQSWYGLIVQAGKNQPDLPDLPTDTQSGDLVQRSITYEQDGDSTATPPTLSVRTVTTLPTPSDMSGKRGWYMDLEQPVTDTNGNVTGNNAQGERMVTPNQFQGNLLLGTTRIPDAATNSDICNSSGTGWVMAVDPFTGTNPGASFFLVNGGTGTVTLPGGQVVPVAGVGFTSLPNNPIFVGGDMLMSFDNGTTSNVNTSGASGVPQRVSWQELVNP